MRTEYISIGAQRVVSDIWGKAALPPFIGPVVWPAAHNLRWLGK
jgi:hypothetical protein